jgi:lysozyme
MTMHIDTPGLELIQRFEGFSSRRYADSVGVLTIGFGTTSSVVDPVPETCTVAQATGWLRQYVEEHCEPAINAVLDAHKVVINQNQFDALCSLAYNCGPGCMEWQIGDDLARGDLAAVGDDFPRYDIAGGRPLAGLTTRRLAEQALFRTPVKAAPVVNTDPNHYQWFDNTPRDCGDLGHPDERDAAIKYDTLRRIAKPSRAEKRFLKLRQDQCGMLAQRLRNVIDADGYTEFHRAWRHDGMEARSEGQRVA